MQCGYAASDTYQKVLEQRIASLEVDVRPPCQMRSLLKKDRVWTVYLAHVDCDFL